MASSTTAVKNFRTEIGGQIDPADNTTYKFPVITSTNSHGAKISWRIDVRVAYEGTNDQPDEFIPIADSYFDSKTQLPKSRGRDAVGWTKVSSWVRDGDVKSSSPTYVREGKNKGRANATNPFTQALRDALGKYNTQLRKAHSDEATEGPEMYPPMLASALNDNLDKINWQSDNFIQRKLNGVRAVACVDPTTSRVVLYSRSRKLYAGFDHIKEELTPVLNYFAQQYNRVVYLDGEVYTHGANLQSISGVARRALDTEEQSTLEYHIYDAFVPAEPELIFSERNSIVNTLFDQFTKLKFVKKVPTMKVANLIEVKVLYEQALADKFEGVMLRIDAPYVYSYNSHRSRVLLKYKPVLDGEYKIIGYAAGTLGKSEGALMFELEIPSPSGTKTLTINLGMELPRRIEMFKEMSKVEHNGKTHFENHYLGKLLTIQYDELSADGVPVRSRTDGIVVRDYE